MVTTSASNHHLRIQSTLVVDERVVIDNLLHAIGLELVSSQSDENKSRAGYADKSHIGWV